MIEEYDHKIDERTLDDFLDFTGYSDQEFWEIVERHRKKLYCRTELLIISLTQRGVSRIIGTSVRQYIFQDSFIDARQPVRPKTDFENIGDI